MITFGVTAKDGDHKLLFEKLDITYKWLVIYDVKLPFKDVGRKEYLLLIKKILKQLLIDYKDNKEYYSKCMNWIKEN